jgi:phosphatidylserine/phosphatidylglycerophosphate/cardiolipin synthase-like enzyme
LHDRLPNDQEPYPLVEILYSHAPVKAPEPDEIIELVAEEMDGIPQSEWKFFLAVRQYSIFGSLDYNHSKLVVRDGTEALVGGHNLVRFVDDPVDDLSMVVLGDSAILVEEHFDAMWRRSQLLGEPRFGPEELGYECAISSNFGPDYACSTKDTGKKYPRSILHTRRVPHPKARMELPGALNVFSLGRGRITAAESMETQNDFSADHAIIAAFDAAEESIKLVQHGMANHVLVFENNMNPEVERSFFEALIERGIVIQLINSDRWPSTPVKTDAERSVELFYEDGWDYVQEHYPERFENEEAFHHFLDCSVQVYRYRYPDKISPLTHAKFFMVDDSGYYVGAQNLYPNVDFLDNLDEESGRQLVNFGYYVDDADETERLREAFWTPVLQESRSERVVPDGRFPDCKAN